MAIPDYQTIMLPLLDFAKDKEEHSLRDAVDYLAEYFKISDDELKELLPSGQQRVFSNRVAWARSYLKQAGLLRATRRGYFQITQRCLQVLDESPSKIDVNFLNRFEEFRDFKSRKKTKENYRKVTEEGQEETPDESLESAYENLRTQLANDLLQQIKNSPPRLFEKIVVSISTLFNLKLYAKKKEL